MYSRKNDFKKETDETLLRVRKPPTGITKNQENCSITLFLLTEILQTPSECDTKMND
jgi:hypothetical protein